MMKTYKLTKQDKELIEIDKEVIRKNRIENKMISCGTGSALITNKNKLYKGVNIESKSSSPTSICGEMGAIAQMLADGGRKIKSIVAVWYDKKKLNMGPPCGAYRHIISQFGNPYVIISKTKKVKLNELYPFPVR